MTRKQVIQTALKELEKAGIVERNGLFRGGQPVYELTKLSAKREEIYPSPAMSTLLRQGLRKNPK